MSFLSPIPIGLVGGDLSGNLPNPMELFIHHLKLEHKLPI